MAIFKVTREGAWSFHPSLIHATEKQDYRRGVSWINDFSGGDSLTIQDRNELGLGFFDTLSSYFTLQDYAVRDNRLLNKVEQADLSHQLFTDEFGDEYFIVKAQSEMEAEEIARCLFAQITAEATEAPTHVISPCLETYAV